MKEEPRRCCEKCSGVEYKGSGRPGVKDTMAVLFCKNHSCSCHHLTIAMLSEEIGKEFDATFPIGLWSYSTSALVVRQSLREFVFSNIQNIAQATYDAVKVDEQPINSTRPNDNYRTHGWNAAKAEQDRNFTSFMGEK